MGLNPGSRAMIAALRAAHPKTGMKKLTIEVNELLPPKMWVEKHKLVDFVRSLDEPTPTVAATKPRDESFIPNTANKVFSLLREAEREFLLNLDRDSINKMHNPSDSPKCHPVAHLRYHLQVLLVLLGVKPCVIFVSPKATGTEVMGEMVLRCLVPLIEQFDLESYGFKLLYVATDVLTADIRFRGFKGCWVFADAKSVHWSLVREIFVAMPKHRVTLKLVCRVLGFPVESESTINQVDIVDHTEYELLRDSFDQDTCQVGVLTIYCDDGGVAEWEAIKRYGLGCRDTAAELGTVLTFDLKQHPAMQEWSRVSGLVREPAEVAEVTEA